jgi:hypothetical protein
MATDQGPQYGVATIRHDAAVLGMRRKAGPAVSGISVIGLYFQSTIVIQCCEPVVKIAYAVNIVLDALIFIVRAHFAEVPQTHGLVFTIRYDIATIALCRYVS